MRDILAYADNFKTWGASMQYAARLAAQRNAKLTGAWICAAPVAASPYDVPDAYTAIVEETRKLEDLAYESRDSFAAWARGLGVRKAKWQVAEGAVPDVLAHIGNWQDLLVLGRDENVPWGRPAMLGSIVLGSRMPCLVVPPESTVPKFDCIAIAWNGSPEAIRAIHAARPFLAQAKRVVALCGTRSERFSEIGWKPEFSLSEYLTDEDLVAEQQRVDAGSDEAGAKLLAAAAEHGADLLVMGAYGRTRFSEWMFGGATRHVLADARIPVLMRH